MLLLRNYLYVLPVLSFQMQASMRQSRVTSVVINDPQVLTFIQNTTVFDA